MLIGHQTLVSNFWPYVDWAFDLSTADIAGPGPPSPTKKNINSEESQNGEISLLYSICMTRSWSRSML